MLPVLFLLIKVLLLVNISGQSLCDLNNDNTCDCYYVSYHLMVNCAWKNIETLPVGSTLPETTNSLDFSFNKLTFLDLKNDNWSKLTMLFLLKASHNEIENVSVAFMKSVPQLTHLDLSNNKISTLDKDLLETAQKLKYLDLSGNSIQFLAIDFFQPVSSLEFLDLSYNEQLGRQLRDLKTICDFLGENGKKLTALKLNAVGLNYQLPNGYLKCENTSLEHLTLADNNLEKVPENLPQTIRILDLSGNTFTEFFPGNFRLEKLQKLYLNRLKNLSVINDYTFFHLLSTLEELQLEDNPKLIFLNALAFGDADQEDQEWTLKKLSLSGNTIHTLNATYFHLFKRISKVDLSHNPWFCNCDLKWMPLLKTHFVNKHYMRCVMPARLRNKNILELSDKEQPKCNLQRYWKSQKLLTIIITVLIIILFALIMYLIYLGPFKKGQNALNTNCPNSDTLYIRDDS